MQGNARYQLYKLTPWNGFVGEAIEGRREAKSEWSGLGRLPAPAGGVTEAWCLDQARRIIENHLTGAAANLAILQGGFFHQANPIIVDNEEFYEFIPALLNPLR